MLGINSGISQEGTTVLLKQFSFLWVFFQEISAGHNTLNWVRFKKGRSIEGDILRELVQFLHPLQVRIF